LRKPEQAPGRQGRGRTGKRAEMGQPEGTNISRFIDRHAENKRNSKNRNILKKEGNRELKHERGTGIEK
jgi:hypothetical protein